MKNSKAKQVLAYIAKNPKAKAKEIAVAVGVNLAYVYTVISKAKAKTKSLGNVPITKEEISDKLLVQAVKRLSAPKKRKYTKRSSRWATVAMFTSDKPISATKDNVNHPAHYKVGGIETIDFIEAKQLSYNLGNVIKYITRADHKGNKVEDLKKAQWYLNRELKNLTK